ncbi:MAG TPA: FRG domain-containing protein [Roseiarcus sp.]|jgi:hypothetical protein
MLLGGQWIARYMGSNKGVLVLDVDQIDDHFEGVAFARDDDVGIPSTAVSFSTTSKLTSQKLDKLPLGAFDYWGKPLNAAQLQILQTRGIQFPAHSDVELTLTQSDELNIAWTTSIGGYGKATAKRSRAGTKSEIQPLNINNWNEFKDFVTNRIERNRYLFRGQSTSTWRLAFHRTQRANLNWFEANDLRSLHHHLSALTRHTFDLKDPLQNLAFINLVQHHGYPSPLLDWTRSPYVAAFFAYRTVDLGKVKADDKVGIFLFDGPEWHKVNRSLNALSPSPPLVVLVQALPLENPRAIPQQSVSSISTVDDIETHIRDAEAGSEKTFLQVIDLAATARREVLSELALMGITAGSLFPGVDGACEALREQNFGMLSRF